MKIYIPKIKESWVVDRFRKEWITNNQDLHTPFMYSSDILWILSPWTWNKISQKNLKNKKVVCTIHHLESENIENDIKNFELLDSFVDAYHIITPKTLEFLNKSTNKKIINIPFWVNNEIWKVLENKNDLRKKFKFKESDYLVGSFQRDTEGKDLKSPKLIKGPDIFINLVSKMYSENKNLKVVLAGRRRQFVIGELKKRKIPYTYFEMVDHKVINELYNILDIYLVTSRIEGGPQAIVECAVTKTPIMSTDVGIASEILSKESIIRLNNLESIKTNEEFAFEKVKDLILPHGMDKFRDMFKFVYEN